MNGFRVLIIAAALFPLLTVALVGLWFDPIPHLVFIGAATAGVLLAIWLILYVSRHALDLIEVTGRLNTALDDDQETSEALVVPLQQLRQKEPDNELVQLLHDLTSRLSERREQLRNGMKAVMEVFCQLADSKQPIPTLADISLPDTEDETLLRGSYNELAKNVLKTRRRAKTFARFLAEFPLPIVVTDKQYKILSINMAGEQLLGQLSQKLYRRSFLKLFVEPSLVERPLQQIIQAPEEVIVNLMCGKSVEALAALRAAQQSVICVALRAKFGHCHIFSLREIKPEGDSTLLESGSHWSLNSFASIHS